MTNNLPAFEDISQTGTNWLPTNRKSQMFWLSTLTAITLVGQYVLLGMTGLGETRATLPHWFTQFELTLWGMRGLVEIFVIVYISMTKTKTDKQETILWGFKVFLILAIVFTVGPIWATGPLGETITSILGRTGVIVWGGGLAGISAAMLAGVATAYKFQPAETGSVVVTFAQYQKMLAIVDSGSTAKSERDKMLVERDKALAEVDGIRQAFAFFRLLPASALAQVLATYNGNVDAVTLAEAFELSPSTVRGVLARINK